MPAISFLWSVCGRRRNGRNEGLGSLSLGGGALGSKCCAPAPLRRLAWHESAAVPYFRGCVAPTVWNLGKDIFRRPLFSVFTRTFRLQTVTNFSVKSVCTCR